MCGWARDFREIAELVHLRLLRHALLEQVFQSSRGVLVLVLVLVARVVVVIARVVVARVVVVVARVVVARVVVVVARVLVAGGARGVANVPAPHTANHI